MNNTPPEYDSLSYIQETVKKLSAERGYTNNSPYERYIKFVEEVGELGRELLKELGMIHNGSGESTLEKEIGDCQATLALFANACEKDLAVAFEKKFVIEDSLKKYSK